MGMDAMEYAALVETAKEDFERDTATLRERIERARKILVLAEEKLRTAQEAFAAQLNGLSRCFAGLEVYEPPHAQRFPETVLEEAGRPLRRNAMDEPLYETAVTLPSPFSAPHVWEAWNAAHPAEPITRSTARGVMERHLRNGRLELVAEGGRGSANPRTYRVKP